MINSQARVQTPASSTASLTFVIILSALMAVTSLSTDIYLPAMPVMAKELHGDVELTITGFLIGFCIAQLIWGPLSDHLGRRKPLFIGMTLMIIMAIAPIAGPLLGGQLIKFTTWHAIFWLLVVIGACLFASLFWLPETLPEEKRVKASLPQAQPQQHSIPYPVNTRCGGGNRSKKFCHCSKSWGSVLCHLAH